MNTTALLALIGDLYAQVAELMNEAKQLREALAQQLPKPEPNPRP